MIRKFEQDFRAADLKAVDGMLAQLTPNDFIAKWDLESRREEILQAIQADQRLFPTTAESALFFNGRPVRSNRGIDSDFAADIIAGYQDMVSKVYAVRQSGPSGERGVVRDRDQSKLQVTEVVHGSFGFKFEEIYADDTEESLFESDLFHTVHQVTRLMVAFDEPDDESYTVALGELDERTLNTVRRFFEKIRDNGATVRVVSGEIDKYFDLPSIERAIQRAIITEVREIPDTIEGSLNGVLPENRDFEYRTTTERGVITGKISREISDTTVALMNRDWTAKASKINLQIKQVVRAGVIKRESFIMRSIEDVAPEAIEMAPPPAPNRTTNTKGDL